MPSEATLAITIDEDASVAVVLGAGDPDDPSFEIEASSGSLDAGAHDITVDITDYFDFLPPEPGDLRWFARIDAATTGTVDGFEIAWGGEAEAATDLPAIEADDDAIVYIPAPPSAEFLSVLPYTAAPGDSNFGLSITLMNTGSDSVGPVTGTLSATIWKSARGVGKW